MYMWQQSQASKITKLIMHTMQKISGICHVLCQYHNRLMHGYLAAFDPAAYR